MLLLGAGPPRVPAGTFTFPLGGSVPFVCVPAKTGASSPARALPFLLKNPFHRFQSESLPNLPATVLTQGDSVRRWGLQEGMRPRLEPPSWASCSYDRPHWPASLHRHEKEISGF